MSGADIAIAGFTALGVITAVLILLYAMAVGILAIMAAQDEAARRPDTRNPTRRREPRPQPNATVTTRPAGQGEQAQP